jgi:hypothetical protein
MQQDVGRAFITYDEPESLGRIEPFDFPTQGLRGLFFFRVCQLLIPRTSLSRCHMSLTMSAFQAKRLAALATYPKDNAPRD